MDEQGTMGQQAQGELYLKSLSVAHEPHTKDGVCLTCFNRSLARQAHWTHKPGERAVKVGRYVGQRQQTGRVRARTDYRAGVTQ